MSLIPNSQELQLEGNYSLQYFIAENTLVRVRVRAPAALAGLHVQLLPRAEDAVQQRRVRAAHREF